VEGEQRPHTPPPFRDGPGSNANLPGPFPPISQLHAPALMFGACPANR
jgi:hypothetical protein